MIRNDISTDTSYLSGEQSRNLRRYTSSLEIQIGVLKRAAIDAYMRDRGFEIQTSGSYRRTGGIFDHRDFREVCERPRADGRGGGYLTRNGNPSGDHYADFDAIRSAIDRLIEKFLDMPDPKRFEEPIDNLVAICNSLAAGDAYGRGPMAPAFANIRDETARLHGRAAYAYKTTYVDLFDTVLDGHCDVATLIIH
ncbi:MAG: hypothetical protein FWD18_08640 [Micrococcales bacterium]|nr:hypothetical protein [Micrococcales bacterium]